MAENKTNIYDLVDQVNKTKRKSAMAAEKEINDIYSMLDDIKNDNKISIEEVRSRVNSYSNNTSSAKINDNLSSYSTLVKKPDVPSAIGDYDTYEECVLAFIQAVDYGTNNSKEYVEGHKTALEKYFMEIQNNHKDIYVVESHINESVNRISSKASLMDKGYYDGLIYLLKSIRKAKELMANKINAKLLEKIG